MTVDFGAWLSQARPLDTAAVQRRAARAWRRINRDPVSVAFTRPRSVAANGTVTPDTLLSAQTVRIVSDNRPRQVEGVAGAAPQRHVVVYGVAGHATVANTDMAEGYRFILGDDEYRIVDVIAVPGELQGIALAVG